MKKWGEGEKGRNRERERGREEQREIERIREIKKPEVIYTSAITTREQIIDLIFTRYTTYCELTNNRLNIPLDTQTTAS